VDFLSILRRQHLAAAIARCVHNYFLRQQFPKVGCLVL
jgi:hypothetical protein